jgi:hypothetical protein
MQKYYLNFSKEIEKFKEEIYFYCDCNIDSEIETLFPAFMNLWPEPAINSKKKQISKKNLAILTSNILDELINKEILKIVNKNAPSVYAFYKIFPHDYLIDYRTFVDKKRALKFR